MSTPALYRKYRPQGFDDVIGQDAVVAALKGAISQEKIAHAYIFSGTRGTGKTSVARIFARAIGTSDSDLYEIDAASNRGIDDIREIRDGVNVFPFESPYKVYIVDEVHMLTKEAWNALLKTLEEPPSHALFILATTELEKIPETIVSRCQLFSFKKPSREILKKVVTSTAKKEGVSLESGVAELIAILGDGSFRDTLGTLQKVITASPSSASSKNTTISLADAETITGAPKGSLVNAFVVAFVKGEKDKAITAIHTAAESGIAMKTFAALAIEKFRIALLAKSAPQSAKALHDHVSDEDWELLSKLGSGDTALAPHLTSTALADLLKAYDSIGRSYIDSLPLELAVIAVW